MAASAGYSSGADMYSLRVVTKQTLSRVYTKWLLKLSVQIHSALCFPAHCSDFLPQSHLSLFALLNPKSTILLTNGVKMQKLTSATS